MESFSSLRFIGIDVSLSETGLAIYTPSDGQMALSSFRCNKNEDLWDCQIRIVSYFQKIFKPFDICCFEAFGMVGRGGRSGKMVERLELSGMLKATACLATGFPYFSVHPKTLKVFISGKGNATKSEMLSHLAQRWAVCTTNDNMGDAAGLAILAAAIFRGGCGEFLIDWKPIQLTSKERQTLNKIAAKPENLAAQNAIVRALAQRGV